MSSAILKHLARFARVGVQWDFIELFLRNVTIPKLKRDNDLELKLNWTVAMQQSLKCTLQPYLVLTSNHGVWKSQKNVSFNIASEARYVYILSGQKFIKMPKIVHFGEFLKNWNW